MLESSGSYVRGYEGVGIKTKHKKLEQKRGMETCRKSWFATEVLHEKLNKRKRGRKILQKNL